MRTLLACSVLVTASLAAGCSPEKHTTDFAPAGPHGVGVRTLSLVDTTRATPKNGDFPGAATRTLPVEVWYPAAPASPPEDLMRDAQILPGGPYPLILHSHGLQDSRTGESYLTEHLASHGYIVAAPDFPLSRGGAPGGSTVLDVAQQPGDLRFVLDRLLSDAALGPSIDQGRIAASGLSLGGLTTLLAAYHPRLRDARIRAALPIAAPSCMFLPAFFAKAEAPLLLLHGDSDLLVPIGANAARTFEQVPGSCGLATLVRGSHTGFSVFATLLRNTQHYDQLGCAAIEGSVGDTPFSSLGSEADGVSSDPTVCPRPCQVKTEEPALDAKRQHELTRILALAFFDGALKGDGAARRFVTGPVAAENPEVQVRAR